LNTFSGYLFFFENTQDIRKQTPLLGPQNKQMRVCFTLLLFLQSVWKYGIYCRSVLPEALLFFANWNSVWRSC